MAYMGFHICRLALPVCTALVLCLSSATASAQEDAFDDPFVFHPLAHSAISGGRVLRRGNELFILPDELVADGSVTVPRICGSLRAIRWDSAGDNGEAAPSIHPEPAAWIVRWQGVPARARRIVLEFDQPPCLLSELKPVAANGDGSIMLHAYQAATQGEKLRYEPQPFKNTVGYWTVPTDTASWQLRIEEPGEFNVGILQGCGAGQGGSRASLTIEQNDPPLAFGPTGQTVATLEFEVVETEHFQNFQWRHLGRMAITQPGVYTLTLAPQSIANAALMDVRAIHLIRLPEATR